VTIRVADDLNIVNMHEHHSSNPSEEESIDEEVAHTGRMKRSSKAMPPPIACH
jgi:hypothetical protein